MGPVDCILFGPLNARVEIALQQMDMKEAVTSWLQALGTDLTLCYKPWYHGATNSNCAESEDKAVRVFVVFMHHIMNNEDAASFMNGYAQMCDWCTHHLMPGIGVSSDLS